jgi:hypothetical protein
MLDIGSSEWLSMKQEDVELIVAAVNTYNPTIDTSAEAIIANALPIRGQRIRASRPRGRARIVG